MRPAIIDSARVSMVKSAAATISGTFMITIATYAALTFTGRFDYLMITALSTLATVLVGSGLKPSLLGDSYLHREWPMPLLIGAGGVALGAEVLVLGVLFPQPVSVAYTLSALAGCSLTLWGNYSLNSVRIRIPLEQRSLSEKLLTP